MSSAEVAKKVIKNVMFFDSQFVLEGPRNFCGHL